MKRVNISQLSALLREKNADGGWRIMFNPGWPALLDGQPFEVDGYIDGETIPEGDSHD